MLCIYFIKAFNLNLPLKINNVYEQIKKIIKFSNKEYFVVLRNINSVITKGKGGSNWYISTRTALIMHYKYFV